MLAHNPFESMDAFLALLQWQCVSDQRYPEAVEAGCVGFGLVCLYYDIFVVERMIVQSHHACRPEW